MERRITPENTKKKIWECYNYKIKEYLARDYRKPKTEARPQRK